MSIRAMKDGITMNTVDNGYGSQPEIQSVWKISHEIANVHIYFKTVQINNNLSINYQHIMHYLFQFSG